MKEFEIDVKAYLTIRGRFVSAEAFFAQIEKLKETAALTVRIADDGDLLEGAEGLRYADYGTVWFSGYHAEGLTLADVRENSQEDNELPAFLRRQAQ